MPLIKRKSDMAFKKNVEAEMDAGKPQKDSLAITYSVKKHAPKGMAKGGMVDDSEAHYDSIADAILRKKHMMADGGMVDPDELKDDLGREAITAMMDDGGMVEDSESEEDLMDLEEPMDSNEHGDELDDEDKLDMVSAIRKKMKK